MGFNIDDFTAKEGNNNKQQVPLAMLGGGCEVVGPPGTWVADGWVADGGFNLGEDFTAKEGNNDKQQVPLAELGGRCEVVGPPGTWVAAGWVADGGVKKYKRCEDEEDRVESLMAQAMEMRRRWINASPYAFLSRDDLLATRYLWAMSESTQQEIKQAIELMTEE